MTAFLSPTVVPLALPYAVIGDGDSIAVGYSPDDLYVPYLTLLPAVTARLNVGVIGQRLDQMTARLAAQVGPWARNAVVVVGGGTNDLLEGDPGGLNPQPEGVDAAGAYARLQAYVAQLRTYRPRAVLLLTVLSVAPATEYYTAHFVQQIAAYNGMVRGGGLGDVVVDVAATTVERSSDGLHPSQHGQQQMADALAPVLAVVL